MGELPLPLPPPPKATRWWAGAALTVAMAVGTVLWLGRDPPPVPTYPVQARFLPAEDGWDLVFDTDELAVVDLVVRRQGRVQVLEHGVVEGKGRWATGDGAYRIHLPGEEALIVSSPTGVPDLEARIQAAQTGIDPLSSLAAAVLAADPVASVSRSPSPAGSGPR